MKFEWEREGKIGVVTIGKQKFRMSSNDTRTALLIIGCSFPHSLQVEPQMNNVVELRVKELK